MAEIEILPPEKPAQTAVYSPSPFRTEYKKITVPWGTTLFEIVEAANLPATIHNAVDVYIGESKINRKYWHRIKVKEGHQVYIRLSLRGGGSGGGKNPLKTILKVLVVVFTVAIAAVAAMAGQWGLAAKVIGIGMSMYALIDALIPPPAQKNKYTWDQQAGNPYGQITGLSNRLAPYSEVPRVIGKRKLFPMLGGRPYTETVGNDQYLRMVLLVGMGPLAISDIKIGETPIANIADAQVEIREGWMNDADLTLYTANIKEDNYQITLDAAGTTATRTTRAGVKEISIDIDAPAGMYQLDKKNRVVQQTVQISVQYRLTGTSGAWINADWIDKKADWGTSTAGILELKDSTQNGVRRSGRWAVAAGQYDVKITRNTVKSTANGADICYFTTLRSILANSNPPMKGLCFIALRLKATAQLNGMPDQINCIAQSYLPVWNGSAWNYQLSRNPAWGLADILRRRAQDVVLADSRLNLPLLTSWASACDAAAANDPGNPYWTFDGIFEGGSIFSAAQQIAAHGRAKFLPIEGTYGVVRDVEQTVPVQHIGPRNSWNYSGSKIFGSLPHAVRVRFYNEEKNYVEDEVLVYRDGYGATAGSGITAATIFETMDLPCCTRPKQAWREGRYHLAVLQLRPETHSVTMDFESLQAGLGQLVRFSHDAISIGLASGRIKSLITNAGNITGVQLDGTVDMVANTAYGIRFRRSDFQTQVCTIQNVGVDTITDTITFSTPIPTSSGLAVGDLFFYGLAGIETAPMIVKSIERQGDLCARITMVDAQSGVWTADSGTIPAHNSYINSVRALEYQLPPAIDFILTTGTSAAKYGADGTVIERIQVSFLPMPSGQLIPASYDIEYRIASSGNFTKVANIPSTQGSVFIDDVFAGTSYEVRVRSIANLAGTDLGSDWTTHTITCQTKTAAPDAPTTLSATNRSGNNALQNAIKLSWINPTDVDLFATEIWRNTTNDLSTATLVANVAAPLATHNDTAIAAGTTYYYWIRAVNFSAIASVYNAGNAAGVLGQPKTGLTIGTTAPTNPQIDDEWINNGTLKVWNGSAWVTKSDITANSSEMIAAQAAISNIQSDNVLSMGEKPFIIRQWAVIATEYSGWNTRGTALGVTTQLTAYQNAYSALSTYLGSVNNWNNTSVDTSIVGATFNQKFTDYYSAKEALAAECDNKASQTSTWTGTTGRPYNINSILQNLNADFDIYTNATGVPDAWLNWSNGSFASRIADGMGGYAMQLYSNGGDNVGVFSQTEEVKPNSYIIAYSKFKLVSGDLTGAGLLTYFRNNVSGTLEYDSLVFATHDDGTGLVGAGSAGKTYTISKIIKTTNSAVNQIQLYAMNHFTSFGAVSAANNIIWYECGWRYATQAEIQAYKATNDIAAISSDTVLSKNEKPDLRKEFDAILADYSSITNQADKLNVDKTAYVTAYNSLYTYLTTLSPSYADYTQDTTIVSATFNQKFTDYYSAKSAIITALAGGLAPQILSAGTELTQNPNFAVWSGAANSFPEKWVDWNNGNGVTKSRVAGKFGSPYAIQFDIPTATGGAKSNSITNGLLDAPNVKAGQPLMIEVVVEAVTNVTWNNFFFFLQMTDNSGNQVTGTSYYRYGYLGSEKSIDGNMPTTGVAGDIRSFSIPFTPSVNANAKLWIGGGWSYDVATAQSAKFHKAAVRYATDAEIQAYKSAIEIANISSDSVLSKSEKPSTLKEWTAIYNETNSIAAQAASLGVDDIARATAYNNLASYLGSLTPSWTDYSQDTPINSTTFNQKWNDYYAAKQNVIASISAKLVTRNQIGLETPNSGFDDWAVSTNLPTQWGNWYQADVRKVRRDDGLGGFALGLPALVGDNYCGVVHQTVQEARPNSYIVIEGRCKLNSGQFDPLSTQFYANAYNTGLTAATGLQIVFGQQKEADGSLIGNGVVGRTYGFAKTFKLDATYFKLQMFCMSVYNGTALTVGNDITWLQCGWRYATEQEIRTFNMEDGADKTANQVPNLFSNVNSVDVQCDYQGTAFTGQLPKTINFTRKKGDTDVSTSTTWSIVGAPSATCAIDTSGVLSISAISSSTDITVRSTRDSVTIDLAIRANKILAAPPNTGTGGTTVQDTSFSGVSSTSHITISDEMTVKTGSNGQIAFSAELPFQFQASTVNGWSAAYAKWQYKTVGGTYADVTTEVLSNNPSYDGKHTMSWEADEPGDISCSPIKTGLSANTDYVVRLMARRQNTSPAGGIYFYGTAMAVGS